MALAPLRDQITLAISGLALVLMVLVVATRSTRKAAVAAALSAALGYSYVFVPPQFSLAITEIHYAATGVIMLAVALIGANLTAGLKQSAAEARRSDHLSRLLYQTALQLASADSAEEGLRIANRMLEGLGTTTLSVVTSGKPPPAPWLNDSTLAMVREGGCEIHAGHTFYVPLAGGGAGLFHPVTAAEAADAEQRRLLITLASLVGIVLERIRYAGTAREALVRVQTESVRNSLLASLSHDVRTPLAALVATADALALSKPALDGTQRELALSIHDQGLRLSGIVGKLLDMARLQSGAIHPDPRAEDLGQVVRRQVEAMAPVLVGHPVQLEMAAGLPRARVDVILLERVLQNLLENAVRAAPRGTPIVVGATLSGGHIEMYVADEGRGVPAQLRDRLFDKFAHENRAGSGGVGLGLAICRAIVELHGGRIWLDDTGHAGACFRFSIPAAD
jgi:two-component system sensor histidine kinase KdpD